MNLSILGGPTRHGSWFLWIRQGCGPYDCFGYFSVTVVFILSALWWNRIRCLWKLPDGRDWLRGRPSLVLMGRTMLSKSLFQFSVEGQGYVPSLFDLRPNYGGGIEDNGDLLEMSHACTTALSASNHVAGQCQHTPLPVTPGYSEASLGQSLMGSLLLSPGSGLHKVLFVPWKTIWKSRRTCTHLLGEFQNCKSLLSNHQQENVVSQQTIYIYTHTPCPREKEKTKQDGRRGKVRFRIKPHTCLRCSEGSNKTLCSPGPRKPIETRKKVCLSVSCRSTGQQWPTSVTGGLDTVDLDMR